MTAPSSSSAEAPITAKSALNRRMNATASSPTMAPSVCRTTPPAMISSLPGVPERMATTLRLLVITTRSRRSTRARATSSVVVPTLTITEQPSGIIAAARAPIARFSASATPRRAA